MRARILVGILALALFAGTPGVGGQGGRTLHTPITIDGNADLCERSDDLDGIVNCAEADGTAARPYRVRGWKVEVGVEPDCNTSATCTPAARCGDRYAAIALCGVTKHMVLEDLELHVRAGRENVAGLLIDGGSNVQVRNVTIRSQAMGIAVLESTGVLLRKLDLGSVSSSDPSAPAAPLAFLFWSNVSWEGGRVEAAGRQVGVNVDAQRDPVHRAFAMRGVHVRGANEWGLHSAGPSVTLLDNVFEDNGLPSTAPYVDLGSPSSVLGTFQSGGASIVAQDGRNTIQRNHFVGRGPGIAVEAGASLIDQNTFDLQGGSAETALYVGTCDARAWLNNFNGSRIVTGGSQCVTDARYNWWGAGASAPAAPDQQRVGGPMTEPSLNRPLEELTRVTITAPLEGSSVHGRVIVRGKATGFGDNTVKAVHYSLSEGAFQSTQLAEGRQEWSFTLNTDSFPLGNITLWVRAEGDKEPFGVPTRLDLVHVPVPRPPVALIQAQPRAARPGQSILLDARDSYSPQGTPLAEYFIDPGDGRPTQWSSQPTRTVEYDRLGLWYATVSVRDAKGLQNTNVAQALIRIDDGGAVEPGPRLVPGPSLVLLLSGLAAFAWWGGRR